MSTTKKTLLKTIRQKCLSCTCDQPTEVKLCSIEQCPLWPFRFASDPYKTPRQVSEAQRENLAAGRKQALAHRAEKSS